MKKKTLRILSMAALLGTAVPAWAIDPPTIATTPVDGGVYVLFNYAKPDRYWSTTSWDGSYYLRKYEDSNWRKVAITAHQDADGWYFMSSDSTYMGYSMGDANLKGKLEKAVHYELTADAARPGFYRIVSKADQTNEYTVGIPLHLNTGGEYVVSTYVGNQWFPDYMGGVKKLEETGDPVIEESTGWLVALDNSSEYWAFADTAKVAQYNLKIQLYTQIKAMTEETLNETIGTGYQGLVDACTALYEKADYSEADLAAAEALIKAKKDLLALIDKAYEAMGESSDETLKAAIDKAYSDFNAYNTTGEMATATQQLDDAITAYKKGQGDVSYMASNLSFEDMSAQGDEEISNVGATPTGWNAFVAGKKVTTTDEVKGAGISAWYGINSDAEGAVDGKEVFGIWNQGMPEFELSQTLTGLPNGTYTVTAGLMVGANGSGSRLTSQRIFGNLNATLYGQAEQYDATQLPNEVLTFAGYEEENTDRKLKEVSVDAYVYDGTLTFGLRTDGNLKTAKRTAGNSGGGDGWFKVDNFRIVSKGYVADDALNVLYHFSESINRALNYPMQGEVNDKGFACIEQYENVNSSSTPEEINAAIVAMKDLLPVITSSVNAYQKLDEATTRHADSYNQYKAYEGGQAYWNAIEDALAGKEDGTLDEAGVEAAITAMDEALAYCKKNGVKVGGELTNLITNASFEDLSAQNNTGSSGVVNPPVGWTLTLDGDTMTTAPTEKVKNWCAINEGDNISVEISEDSIVRKQPTDGTHLWGIWTPNIPEVELSQTLTGMPAGTYLLKADVMVEYNWAGSNLTTQRIFGNDCVQMWARPGTYDASMLPADAKLALDYDTANSDTLRHLTYAGHTCDDSDKTTQLLKGMQVRFGVQQDGILKLGFRTNGTDAYGSSYGNGSNIQGLGWFKIDNFRLYYESTNMQASGVADINAATQVTGQKYYTIDGRETAVPQRGLIIVKTRMADGTVKVQKTIVR